MAQPLSRQPSSTDESVKEHNPTTVPTDFKNDELHDEKQTDGLDAIQLARTTTKDYPTGARLTALVVSLMLSMFLVALDNVRV
jgi:hypothetical protein